MWLCDATLGPAAVLIVFFTVCQQARCAILGDPRCWDEPAYTYETCCDGAAGLYHGGDKRCWIPGTALTFSACCAATSLLLNIRLGVNVSSLTPSGWRRWEAQGVALQVLNFVETWNFQSRYVLYIVSEFLELHILVPLAEASNHLLPTQFVDPDAAGLKLRSLRNAEELRALAEGLSKSELGNQSHKDFIPGWPSQGPLADRFFFVLQQDDDALAASLSEVRRGGGRFIAPYVAGFLPPALPVQDAMLQKSDEAEAALRKRYLWADPACIRAVDRVRGRFEELGRINPKHSRSREDICQILHATRELHGSYVEVGVLYGESAALALAYLSESGLQRKANFVDTFEGFNYLAANELSVESGWFGRDQLFKSAAEHMAYLQDLLMPLAMSLDSKTVVDFELIKGEVSEADIGEGPVAAAFVDVDVYEATWAALERIAPRIPQGGLLLSEDAATTPYAGGAWLALREFEATVQGRRFVRLHLGQTYALVAAFT